MRAELGEQRLMVAACLQAIENDRGLTRRKTHQRHIALAPALIRVVVAAKADDRWSPHLGLLARRTLHQLNQRLGVRTLGLVRERIEIRRNTYLGGLGLAIRHSCLSSFSKANPEAGTGATRPVARPEKTAWKEPSLRYPVAMKMSHLLVPIVAVAGMAFAGSVTPFNLDLSGFGPTIYTVQSQTVASGLDYPYGMAAIGNGSILFGESTPKTAGGIEGGPSTGSVWLLPIQPDGSYGAPQPVI